MRNRNTENFSQGSFTKLFAGFQDVHIHENKALGFIGIIAVHDTTLGPALGGCRRQPYPSLWDAFVDVSRLARGMTYKAALSRLPLGGGKCLLIPTKHDKRLRKAQYQAMGRFIDSLAGTYISAEDVGTSVADVHEMGKMTPFVTGSMKDHPYDGNPSPFTALGVLHGMKGAMRALHGTPSLAGRTMYVEGVGNVGMKLAELLHKEGAVLYVSNRTSTPSEQAALKSAEERFSATRVELNEHGQPRRFPHVDIYVPCALGGVVNEERIETYPSTLSLIAGSANNVLLDASRDGELLRKRKILYAPDYVINNGGLIDVHHQWQSKNHGVPYDPNEVSQGCTQNETVLYEICSRAIAEEVCPHRIADTMAEKVLKDKKTVFFT